MKNIEFNTGNADTSKANGIITSRMQFIVEFLKPLNGQSTIFSILFGFIFFSPIVVLFHKIGFISRIENEAISQEPSIEISKSLTKPTEVLEILQESTKTVEELIEENEEILQKAVREEEFVNSGLFNMMQNLQNIFKSNKNHFDQDNINSVIQLSSSAQKISDEANNAKSVETLMKEGMKIEQTQFDYFKSEFMKIVKVLDDFKLFSSNIELAQDIQALKSDTNTVSHLYDVFSKYIDQSSRSQLTKHYIFEQMCDLYRLSDYAKTPIIAKISDFTEEQKTQIADYIKYLQFEAIKFIKRYIKQDSVNVIKNKYLDYDIMERIRIEELKTDQKYSATKLLEALKQQNAITQQVVERIRRSFTLRFVCIIDTLTPNDFQRNFDKDCATHFIQDLFTSESQFSFLSKTAEIVIAKAQLAYLKSECLNIIKILQKIYYSLQDARRITENIEKLQYDTKLSAEENINKKTQLRDFFKIHFHQYDCCVDICTKAYILKQIKHLLSLENHDKVPTMISLLDFTCYPKSRINHDPTIISLADFTKEQKTQIKNYIQYLQLEAIKFIKQYIKDTMHFGCLVRLEKWLFTSLQQMNYTTYRCKKYTKQLDGYCLEDFQAQLALDQYNEADITNDITNIINQLKSQDPAVRKLAESYTKLAESYRRSFTLGFVCIINTLGDNNTSFKDNYKNSKTEIINSLQDLFVSESHLGFYADVPLLKNKTI